MWKLNKIDTCMLSINGNIYTLTSYISDLVDLNLFNVLIRSFFNLDNVVICFIPVKNIPFVACNNALIGFNIKYHSRKLFYFIYFIIYKHSRTIFICWSNAIWYCFVLLFISYAFMYYNIFTKCFVIYYFIMDE